jgi:hypothetical protein
MFTHAISISSYKTVKNKTLSLPRWQRGNQPRGFISNAAVFSLENRLCATGYRLP